MNSFFERGVLLDTMYARAPTTDMEGSHRLRVSGLFTVYIPLFISLNFPVSSSFPSQIPLGIHPLDEKYFASELIKCKDGLNSFTRDRINDEFCDCVDGTDEPDEKGKWDFLIWVGGMEALCGTSACPAGKFYCRNVGSTPRFLFSSRVNDHICDCCDGSDENDGNINCPNTCMMGGNIAYKTTNYGLRNSHHNSVATKPRKNRLDGDDVVQKIQGLKVVTIIQVVLVTIVVLFFCLFRRRAKSRRRHSR